MLPEYKKRSKPNRQPRYINKCEEWISYQQAKGEFEVVEEHYSQMANGQMCRCTLSAARVDMSIRLNAKTSLPYLNTSFIFQRLRRIGPCCLKEYHGDRRKHDAEQHSHREHKMPPLQFNPLGVPI